MDLHYIDEGIGPAVLLIHAFPLDSSMWAPQIAALKDRFRVIAPDVRGFGKSPVTSAWKLDDAADDMAELLDSAGVQDCAVVGLSMGGYIAVPFYARYAARVRALVLADTRARADTDAEKAARTALIAELAESGIRNLPDRMLPRLLKPSPQAGIVNAVRRTMETTTAIAATFALMAMRDRADASTVLYRISCPGLVIAGEEDAITRLEECRSMAETIANGKFVSIPGAGHLSNMENPADFNRALLEFL